jgi:hypothetical protein
MFSVITQPKSILAALLLTAVTAFAQPTPVLPGYSVSLLASGLSWPSCVIFRPAAHDLLVCQMNGNTVSRIDLATGAVTPFGVVAIPEHIAIDSRGHVYLTTNDTPGALTILSDSTGQTLDTFFVSGHPDGLAVDARNNLYFANNSTKVILEYAAGSGFNNPTVYASGFESLQGITFDPLGRLFAEDYSAGIVYYVTPSANTVWGTGIGSYYDSMLDIAYVPNLGILASTLGGTVSVIPSQGVVTPAKTSTWRKPLPVQSGSFHRRPNEGGPLE